jgi:hypothetical protein
MPRVTCTALHAVVVGIAAWIYFGEGAGVLSSLVGQQRPEPGDFARRVVSIFFATVAFVRITITFFILLKQRFPWSEFWGKDFDAWEKRTKAFIPFVY